ncbi:hypothetical protein MTR_1g071270 [Medicago truncatula]|uniref:RecQ-mediated genome instability protein 1 n=1 Tax=Medicago truncatula TaxID=3880 RepID=G7ICR3_MEDTR|nr:hypothetical protein MTR_1g071270 [Medicago truncatula]
MVKGKMENVVDEFINILDTSNQQVIPPPGINRILKFKLTDGVQTVDALEYYTLEALQVCEPPGLKGSFGTYLLWIEISNVEVRHGMLSLVPGNIRILGGGLVEPVDETLKWVVDDPSHSDSMLPNIDTILASMVRTLEELSPLNVGVSIYSLRLSFFWHTQRPKCP